jgi:membrane protease YdiL (CAAX protease family)
MQQVNHSNYPSNAFGRFWKKVPLVVRSILLGFGVSSLGVGIWVLLVTYLPVPWSVVAMGAILVLFWMYFNGKWYPSSTQAFRRFCVRQIKLKRSVWIWGLMAAFSIIILLHSGFILTFRIYEFQPEIFKTARWLNDFPAWASWSIILMASLVAGICEEIGYRGYMQKPLEQKYGPVAGISITSLVFVVVHLHQAWANGILMGIFAISFIIGYLAYSTNSLLPGIIAHVSFDIINFSYWWSDVIGTFEREPISMTGVDNHFIVTTMVVFLSTVLILVSIRKLLKMKDSVDFIYRPNMPDSSIMKT